MFLKEHFNIEVTSPERRNIYAPKTSRTAMPRPVGITLLKMDAQGMVDSNALPSHESNAWCERQNRVKLDSDFHHASSVREIETLLANGDHDLTARVVAMSDRLADPMPVDARRKIVYREDGDEVDETRWLDHDFDHMWRRTERHMRRTTNKVIDVGFMWGGNCTATRTQLEATGAAAIALVNKLESLGYSCGIRAFGVWMKCYGDDNNAPKDVGVNEISMKHPGEPLNVEAVAALGSHPAPFRFYGISAHRFGHFQIGHEMGTILSERNPEEAQRILDELAERRMIEPCTIMLPRINTFDEARKAIETIISNLDEIENEFLNDR